MLLDGIESIEFLDYIFDRYAFLKIDQTASEEEIRRAIRDRKVQNHPDRFQFAEENVKDEPRRNWNALIRCEDVLLNPELRPLYDQRLAHFREHNPEFISTDGSGFINVLNPRHQVNIKYLLSSDTFDISPMVQKAALLSGHSPEKVARARRLYERDPEDRDFKSMYRDALEKQIAYYKAIEQLLWAAAGVLGKRKDDEDFSFDTKLLERKVAGHITHVRDTLIPQQVEQREALQALGYDKNPLLLLTHAGREITVTTDKAITNETISRAQTRFEALSKAIKENAADQAQTIEDILSLCGFSLLHKADLDNTIVHLLVPLEEGHGIDDATVLISMTSVKDEAKHIKGDFVYTYQNVPYGKLKEGPFDRTTATIFSDRAVNPATLSIGYAHKMIAKAFGKQHVIRDGVIMEDASVTAGSNQSASRPLAPSASAGAATDNALN